MEKTYLEEDKQYLYKKFLNLKDYQLASEESGFSMSTVLNIVNRRTRVNMETQIVIDCLDIVLTVRMGEVLEILSKNVSKYLELKHVKKHNNLTKKKQWIS